MARQSILRLLKACHRENIPIEITLDDGTSIKLPLTESQSSALFEPPKELKEQLNELRTRARAGFNARKPA